MFFGTDLKNRLYRIEPNKKRSIIKYKIISSFVYREKDALKAVKRMIRAQEDIKGCELTMQRIKNKGSKAVPPSSEEIKENRQVFSDTDLKSLVGEALKEFNTGQGYGRYPYHSDIGMEEEESEDFMQDWKDLELSLVRDETRNTAVQIAKILVKDLELFGDVIDIVGSNQSLGTEILKKLRKNEEKS